MRTTRSTKGEMASGGCYTGGEDAKARKNLQMPGRLDDKVAIVTGAGAVGPG